MILKNQLTILTNIFTKPQTLISVQILNHVVLGTPNKYPLQSIKKNLHRC